MLAAHLYLRVRVWLFACTLCNAEWIRANQSSGFGGGFGFGSDRGHARARDGPRRAKLTQLGAA